MVDERPTVTENPWVGDEDRGIWGDEREMMSEAMVAATLRRINARKAHIETVKANAEALIKEDERIIDAIMQEWGPQLEAFLHRKLTGKSRSWRCLEGVLGMRRQPSRFVVTDERAALAWAADHCPDAVTERIDVKALRSPEEWGVVDKHTGELVYESSIPGVELVPGRDVLYAKPVTRKTNDNNEE